MAEKSYDFSGYATRYGLRCSDGVTIRHGAFNDHNGKRVPLVWQHQHNSPSNVIGHVDLESRDDGLYAYGAFNSSIDGKKAKLLVEHGDVDSLSIYANHLTKSGSDVMHGLIREVSLVLAGANPGAYIDFPVIAHGDELCELDDEATIFSGEGIQLYNEDLTHADDENTGGERTVQDVLNGMTDEQKKVVMFLLQQVENQSSGANVKHSDDEKDTGNSDKTVQDVLEEMTDEQKKVVMFLLEQAKNGGKVAAGQSTNSVQHADSDNESEILDSMNDEQLDYIQGLINFYENKEDTNVKHNVFEQQGEVLQHNALTADDVKTIFDNAKRGGSLKEAVEDYIQHTDPVPGVDYGISNIDYLFPDAKTVTQTPGFIKREMAWVSTVMQGTKHLPFSRIKSVFANITADEARAKGYIKGKKKLEEVFLLLKRQTTPQTIYKKQKLDKDDIIDITDFNVVTWLRAEMRMMLDEEIARAILIGDGRNALQEDKINPERIRPIYTDDDLYTIKAQYAINDTDTADQRAKKFIRKVIKARKDYKGSGNPVLFTTEDMLTDLLLLEDGVGRIIYDSVDKLATMLRVSKIVTVPVMENLSRSVTTGSGGSAVTTTYYLDGILVNLNDYAVGADKGGAVSMFDDFDIDYNQEKYLIETRCSGALTVPYSAITVEHSITATNVVEDAGQTTS